MATMSILSKVQSAVSAVGAWFWLLGPGGILWITLGWVSSHFSPIAQYGWAADVLAGVIFASVFMFGTGVSLAGWRYFMPLAKKEIVTSTEKRNAAMHAPSPPIVIPRVKEFCRRSPSYLMAFYNGRTMLQATAMIQPYIGLWISVSGPIITIYDGGGEVGAALRADGVTISCRFKKEWAARLARFNERETLEVGGFIGPSQNGQQLYLEDCEISL